MRVWIVLLGCVAVVGCGGVGLAATAPARPASALSSNKHAARQDARRLLQRLQLPAGAVSIGHEPAGDHGWLKPLKSILGSMARAGAHAWWAVPGTPSSVLGYVESHPPAGATKFESGSGSDRSGSREQDVGYRWPAVAGILAARLLQVTVTALPGGRTGVLAQAQSDWLVPRPAGERVPSGVRSIELRVATAARRTIRERAVTSSAKIRRIVSLIDAMPVVQPDVIMCPDLILSGGRVITLNFQGASRRTLAEASYFDYPPLNQASRECNPVAFSVRGRQETPLVGGNFVEQLARILGVGLIG